MSKLDTKISTLLRDFGFRVDGNNIIEIGIARGPFACSDRVFRRCRSHFDAAEQLIPIIADDDFQGRFKKLTSANAN